MFIQNKCVLHTDTSPPPPSEDQLRPRGGGAPHSLGTFVLDSSSYSVASGLVKTTRPRLSSSNAIGMFCPHPSMFVFCNDIPNESTNSSGRLLS
jgi:hypothetical protein